MTSSLSGMNLDDDLDGVKRTDDSSRWELKRAGVLEVWATMSPSGHPGEKFTARLLWSEYPSQPPSVRFVDPATGRHDTKNAWPVIQNVRLDGHWDICQSMTLEGFAAHPEWRNDARFRWDSRGNVLLKILRWLQELMDETFQKRAS